MWRLTVICVRLTVVLCLAEGVVLAGSRQADPDPFAAYEAIMPGQSSDALEHYPCNSYRDDTSTEYCTFTAKEGPFSSVSLEYDHAIRRIGFVVRPDSLHVSDLILCWGRPANLGTEYLVYEGWAQVFWSKELYAVIGADWNDTHLSYHLPIYYVSIVGEGRRCRSS